MTSSVHSSTSTPESATSSWGDNGNHIVAPSGDDLRQTLARSTLYWNGLARKGHSTQMGNDSIQLTNLLHKVPALPEDLENIESVRGYASWARVSPGCRSSLSGRDGEERCWSLDLPSRRPTFCSIANQNSYFTFENTKLNGVSFLFLGWAYILSVNLLERQRIGFDYLDLPSRLTNRLAFPSKENSSIEIYIGEATAEEWRWWSALVALGRGWRARNSPDSSPPPWTIANVGKTRLNVTAKIMDNGGPDDCQPPSSRQAFGFLSKFVSAYDLGGQASLALSMVLSLPLHNHMHNQAKFAMELPTPTSFTRGTWRLSSISRIQQSYDSLSYYLSLSSNPQFLSSALWGIFWEPGVDCNLVSAWFEPVIRVVCPLIESGNVEVLGHIFAHRNPNIAPLWYGVLACGRTTILDSIIHFLKTLIPPIPSRPMPDIAAWTGSAQSFIDLAGSGPYLLGDRVAREDVWRLRHECYDLEPEGRYYKNSPLCPWPPFGTIPAIETELSVRAHLDCCRHEWVYATWTWLIDGRGRIVDDRYRAAADVAFPQTGEPQRAVPHQLSIPEMSRDNIASKQAIGDIFRWATMEMEPSGKEIYSHQWVQALVDLDGPDEPLEAATPGPPVDYLERVQDWLEMLDTEKESLS